MQLQIDAIHQAKRPELLLVQFAGEAARDVAKRLADDENMLCLPGSMFGPGQEDYLRFAFANVDADKMPEIARRLGRSARHGVS